MMILATLGHVVHVVAETDGLWFRPDQPRALSSIEGWPAAALAAEAGRATAIELGQLLEQGLAEKHENTIRIPYECFAALRRLDYRSTTRWTEWSPFVLSIAPVGDLGRQGFNYRYRFRLGATEVSLRRMGYFVQRTGQEEIFHIDDQTFALVEAMDRYNSLPEANQTSRENWVTFALIKDCASTVGAALDRLLQANEVVVPSRVGVRILSHEDGSASFVPRCESVPDEALASAFRARPNAEGVYSVDLPGGSRMRVVLDDEQQQVLARLQRLQNLRGAAKEEAIRNPAQYFDGLLGRVDLPYGRRVEGIGDFPFASTPKGNAIRTGIFDGVERAVAVQESPAADADAGAPGGDRPTSIQCNTAGGEGAIRVTFPDTSAREDFRQRVTEALAAGQTSVPYAGFQVAIDNELAAALSSAPASNTGTRGGRYLLIYTDEEDLRAWDEEVIRRVSERTAGLAAQNPPRSLAEGVELKPHQHQGLQWLQHCSALQPDRRGCLLADDMGLGKTLQVLTYLAWSIEQGKITAPGGDLEAGPWRPILIIAPLILVEAGTWRAEMERFFRNAGTVFEPVKVLHGNSINEFRSERAGREIEIGAPTLAAEKLMRCRVIITTYETVKNYQHSFAQTVQGSPLWSIVITDEAQEYKTPNTKVSHAVKALQPDFHIACTGTPVENRLLDVWNIMDALQPALLGTAREFSAEYERAPGAEVSSLRERLLFQAPNAFVIRRDKDTLRDLPQKITERLFSDMSEDEVRLHNSLVAGLRHAVRGTSHLSVLHRLSALYQHPSLLDDSWTRKASQTLQTESSKLQRVIQQLHAIRGRGEKALIFARLVDMQQLLATVLRDEFQLRVQIINGTSPRGAGGTAATNRARQTRSQIIQDFKNAPGFHVLILSPFVAGIGLTLTEANHVIHYGRWWNPAVESQATDRVYRIGQTKRVTVYLPILRDTSGRIQRSFDECLDRMLEEKAGLARDFLYPMPGEDTLAEELRDTLAGKDPAGARPLDAREVQRLTPSDFEALVACLYRHKGHRVVLTSRSNDGGADVVAIGAGEAILIQAKHSAQGNPVTAAALGDIVGAQTIYQDRIPHRLRLHVVTNSHFDNACTAQARQQGVALIGGADLRTMIEAAGTTQGDIAAINSERAVSFDDGLTRILREE